MAVRCLPLPEARELLRFCLEQGEVVPGKHFRDELRAEGLVFEDAWAVLSDGAIYDPSEPDLRSGSWWFSASRA